MASGSASNDLLNHLAILATLGAVGDLSDADLLRRYLAGPDAVSQAALTALVDRHGPMVFRLCRHILADTHDAQDAFQATFLVLARKAESIHTVESVVGWLHGVAIRVARRARADAGRRRSIERRGATMKIMESESQEVDPDSWTELHEEIARLPVRYREPVVLCYLEGLSTEAAALRIGCPRGTVLSRLSGARDRLRRRLTSRGLAPSRIMITGDPTPESMAALPPTLLGMTVRGSLTFAGRRVVGSIPTSIIPTSLASGVIQAMMISRLKLFGCAALAVACVLGGVQVYAYQKTDDPPAVLKAEPAAPSAVRWGYEYRSVRLVLEDQLAEKANEEAKQGWEVFQVVPYIYGTASGIFTKYTILSRRQFDPRKGRE